MCIAIPAIIEKIDNNEAIVDYEGVKLKVNVLFIEKPRIGDYVLVHAGCAIQKIDEEYARETLDIFRELSEVMEGEC